MGEVMALAAFEGEDGGAREASTTAREASGRLGDDRGHKQAERAPAIAEARGREGQAGGDHGKLDSHQLALRDTAIMARLHEGASRSAVAAEFAISRQAVDGVVARWHKARSPLEGKPMETIDWLARRYLRQVGDLEAMAAANAERNPSVALGAKKAAGDALSRYTELLIAVGALPQELHLLRSEAVLRHLAEEMVDTMERVEAGELSPADASAFFRQLVSGRSRCCRSDSGGRARVDQNARRYRCG
jgi:hypothetical protein